MIFRAATWNVNSIRQRLAHLGRFVDLYHPDLVCLQETKVRDDDFPADEIRAMGFETVLFHGQKSYNGVAILVKGPVCHHQRLIWCGQDDRRHLAVVLDNGLHVHNFYVPSGGGVPDATVNDKFAHKLQFLDEMGQWVAETLQKEQKMLLLGDLNVAPFDNDVWNHKRLQKQIGHTPGECDRLIALHNRGDLIDVGRHFIPPDQPLFSWWGYRYKLSVQKDYGWRLDHILASQALRENLCAFHVVRDTRLWDRPSDHVPLIVDLQIENLLPLQVAKIKSNRKTAGMYKMRKIISQEAVDRQLFWIEKIAKLSGHFELDSNRIEAKISDEIADNTLPVLLDHLRLCSAIP